MPTRILLRLLLLAGLAAPLCAFALGVGPLTVRSALNQNFEAEIPLIVNNPAELVGLVAHIPRQKEFDQMGIERLEFLSKLRFAVQTIPGGPSSIKVTSVQPIRDPNFDLLVEVIWPRGRLLRTFPVQLDPELYADRRPPPPPPVAVLPVETPPLAAAPVTPEPPTAPPVSFEGASTYGPVKRGENLTRIAEKARPSSAISGPDMMAILVAGNPNAFTNGNPNTLRVGAVLRVPSPQALGVSGTPAPEVALATPPTESTISPPAPVTPPPETVASPVLPEQPAAPTAPPVAPSETTPTAPPVALSETTPIAPPPPTEIAPTVAESLPSPLPIAPLQEIIPQATIPRVETQPTPVETATPPPAPVETPPPVVEAKPPQPVVTPPPAVKLPIPPQPTDMDWLSNPVVWIAIALIVLAVGSVLLLPLLRRPARSKTTAPVEEPTPTSDTEKAEETVSHKAEGQSKQPIPASPTEITATRLTPKAVVTPPPKPIDELLKDIDFNLGGERAQTTPAGKGASTVVRSGEGQRLPDAEPPTASVTRMPDPFASAPPTKPVGPAPSPTPAPLQPPLEPPSELPSGLRLDRLDFDLSDLGLNSPRRPTELPPLELKPVTPSKSAEPTATDFNFPNIIEPPLQPEPTVNPAKPKASDLKFEFADVSQQTSGEDLARLDEDLRSFDDGGLNLGKMELSSLSDGGSAGADYVETKLDLAAAYLDMGDQVGARGLLEDVLQEGDAAQKKRAGELLKKLG